MVNERMFELGNEPSAIRELFAYGMARKAEIGNDNVFDFSIGNPSVPAPDAITQAVLDLMKEPATVLHGYTPAAGDPEVRKTIADSISRRFGIHATADRLYMTVGAAASLAISISALTHPGDEVMVVSPYFPEYKVWIETARCACVEVPAHVPDFQLDLNAIAAAITPKTSAIIINSPNNPVGAVYSEENLRGLAELLTAKEVEFGRKLYLISDEPYREIVYDGIEVPYIPNLYARTLVCYSYSKSFSLPGERIGYIYVSNRMDDAAEVYTAVCGAGRALGYICAPVLFQRAIARCVDVPSDVASYAANRALLTDGLSALGYEFVEPQGAFYLWVRALEEDARAFSERAKAHELLLVPSDSFGVEGWVRVSYCVSADVIRRSLPAFESLMSEYR
ncbi:MAG: pyridoxal phosphate-dependent aminotransferase [Gordonibacter sp.]|nr:pyridoxal phosphate-dependent aminotransferase [Gordonibacter sp.]